MNDCGQCKALTSHYSDKRITVLSPSVLRHLLCEEFSHFSGTSLLCWKYTRENLRGRSPKRLANQIRATTDTNISETIHAADDRERWTTQFGPKHDLANPTTRSSEENDARMRRRITD